MYSLMLFLHVVGAVGIFAAIGMEVMVLTGCARAANVERVRGHTEAARLVERLFPVSSALLLLTGLYMLGGRWQWSAPWAWVGLVALIAMSGLGPALNGKRFAAIAAVAREAADGPVGGALARLVGDRGLRASVAGLTGGAIGVLFVMTAKPGVVSGIVAIVVGTALGAAVAALPTRGRGTAMGA